MKFAQIYATKSVKAAPTVRKLEKFIDRFGAPKRFITNKGTACTSDVFKKFEEKEGILHTLDSTKHSQANC